MIIIGEKINATRKSIAKAIADRNADHIVKTATQQAEAGAHYLDVNGGDPNAAREVANMEWLVNLIQEHSDLALSIDSANAEAMEVGLKLAEAKPILNSISLEAERMDAFLPIVKRHECMVVALCMSDDGTPTGADDRVARAEELIKALTAAGKKEEEIIVDPCFFPASAQPDAARCLCEAIARIRQAHPEVHIGGGLSNTSYGLPKRRLVNLAMIAMATYHGMDAALVDPCVPELVPMILASEALSGADEFCMNYVTASREGRL
jgi:5-methyltetrahydrofolate--homocysteine methyltransferase